MCRLSGVRQRRGAAADEHLLVEREQSAEILDGDPFVDAVRESNVGCTELQRREPVDVVRQHAHVPAVRHADHQQRYHGRIEHLRCEPCDEAVASRLRTCYRRGLRARADGRYGHREIIDRLAHVRGDAVDAFTRHDSQVDRRCRDRRQHVLLWRALQHRWRDRRLQRRRALWRGAELAHEQRFEQPAVRDRHACHNGACGAIASSMSRVTPA